MQGRISLLAKEANGGVYQSQRGKLSSLWLLLIKHDVPPKSAVFHAGTWGGPSVHLMLKEDDWQCDCQQEWVDPSDAVIERCKRKIGKSKVKKSTVRAPLTAYEWCFCNRKNKQSSQPICSTWRRERIQSAGSNISHSPALLKCYSEAGMVAPLSSINPVSFQYTVPQACSQCQ